MWTVGLTRPPTSAINNVPGEGDGSATGKVSSRTSEIFASAGTVVEVESVCRRCGGGNNNNVGVVSISVGGFGKSGGGGDVGAKWLELSGCCLCLVVELSGWCSCVVVVAVVFCVCQS